MIRITSSKSDFSLGGQGRGKIHLMQRETVPTGQPKSHTPTVHAELWWQGWPTNVLGKDKIRNITSTTISEEEAGVP